MKDRWYLWLTSAVLMTSLMDCSPGSPDFIAEQCSEYDTIAFDGRYYRWTPYEKGGESCELLCKAEGLSSHQKLPGKVVDGTPCGQKPFSVCVNGHCRHTGCDGQLGSNMTLDNCGVCGGDGTSCSLIDHSGIFNKKTLSAGYNKVVTIPSGSVAVEIKDLGPTLNTLVLVDGSVHQMVLARDVKEAQFIFADTIFIFNTHEQQGQLRAVGPTAHNITVYMHNQGDWNPGVSYHYKTVQNDLFINPRKSHHKSQKLSKGQKLQADIYEQRSANEQNEAEPLESKGSDILTLKGLDLREEIQNIPQNMLISTNSFNADSDSNNNGVKYGSYDHMIGSKGRDAASSAHAGSIWPKNAHRNLAKDQEDDVIQRLPEYFISVRQSTERYMWSFGDWTGCSRKCGPGVQRRVISCIDRELRKIVDPHMCRQREKPVSMQSCYNRECSVNHPHDTYVRWQPGEWGLCSSSCDLGVQVQEVVCQAVTEEGSTAIVRDDQCYKEYGTKPEYVRSCNEDFPCPKWSFTVWSECSVTCGRGEQKRYVFCQQETAIESGIQKTIADNFCDISLKPVEYILCSSGPCPKQHHQNRTRPTGFQESCVHSYYRCCPDGVNPARGPRGEGCPSQENIVISEDDAKNKPKCLDLEFGCCWDQVTAASGPNSEGCPPRYSKSQARCNSHPDVGSCRNFTVKWFYNTNTTQCDRFWYGGCDGNGNRFSDEKECLDVCKNDKAVEKDICDLPAVVGPCRAAHIRWYYEGKEKKCKNFTYGGCDGNDNRFRTQAECERRCSSAVLALSGDREPVTALLCEQSRYGCCQDGVTPATGPNSEGCPKDCQNTRYGCCDDGITAAQGEDGKGCEVVAGSGDIDTFCEESVFGCCPDGTTPAQGENNLGCEDVVSLTDSDSGFYIEPATNPRGTALEIPRCEQEKKTGNCRAYIVRWFHNTTSRHCEQFFYGGCEGNDNNFETREACEKNCSVVQIGSVEPSRNVPVCEQPNQPGMCLAYFPRWFYNRTSDRCEHFIYGGCQGNDNNFETKEACAARCPSRMSSNVILPVSGGFTPVCQLEPDMGPCRRAETKWHYNVTTFSCKTFTYGGCLGNHNNFQTKEKCEEYCNMQPGQSVRETCLSSREPGSCTGQFRRWYYNSETGRCSEFMYGGCQGNGNNFLNEDSCMNYCRGIRLDRWTDNRVVTHPPQPAPQPEDICRLPLKTPCNDNTGLQYWYYDYNEGVCREVLEGQCNDNQNNFESKERCEAHCSRENVCRPFTQGVITCAAAIPRWLYNRETNKCEEFIYGGCGGTSNNFASKDACRRKCLAQGEQPVHNQAVVNPTTAEEICALNLEVGNALSGQQHWYYDKLTGQCKEFTGSSENRNNFASKEWCEGYCTREVVCQEFVEPEISCYAHIPRWRYNPRIGRCEYFVYGGCGGNTNNFEREEDCTRKCVHQKSPVREPSSEVGVSRYNSWDDICKLQADVGPCANYMRKWHYNALTRECEEFTYGGCLGNHNNFESREQCKMYCDKSRVRESQVEIAPGSGSIQGVEACHLDVDAGTCDSRLQMWHYDYPSGVCKQFLYRGCDGNDNRFDTREECEGICNAAEICQQPMVIGRCRGNFPRYYFDMWTGECREFGYGGCDGNANNFASKEACQRKCGYLADQRPRSVITKTGYCPSVPNNVVGICVEACRNDGDCPGDQKCCSNGCGHTCVTPVEADIKKTAGGNASDVCHIEERRELCTKYEVKWFFDRSIQRCNRFWYGGCEGRGNKFDTEEECQDVCVNRKHGGQVTPIPTSHPSTRTPEPECRGSQYGCCRDGRTPAIDRYYSNCPETSTDCRLSRFGCCPDGVTAVVDRYYSNCRVNRTDTQTERDDEVTQVLVQPGKRAVMTCYRENYNASIAWYREGLLITPDNNFFIYPNGTLVIQFISSGDAGSYSCRITHGNLLPTIRRFKVTVQEPIRILPTPDTIIVKPGHTAFLHCQAQGSPQPRISWTKGNEPIRTGGRFDVFENGTLLIARTQPEDIDFYVCRAENGISVAVQRTVRLSLKEMLMAKIVNHQNQVTEGGRISLHCSGSGFPTPTVQWEKMGRPITTGGNVYVSDGRLVIRDVTPEDTGVYTCIVANNEEKIESSTTIQVMPKDIQADTCKDIAGEGKCRLIVYAGLCSYKMYSTICCNSCQNKLA